MYKKCNCMPTYLVTSVTDNGGANYILNFKTVPTLQNKEVIQFRLGDCITTATNPGLQIYVNVNVNGVLTSVPLRDKYGNNIRSVTDLKTRKNYRAVFGTDTEHLQLLGENCRCLKV